MLSFADTAWQVFTAIAAFAIGMVFVISQRALFGVPRSLAVCLYLWHSALCMYYMYYSLHNIADSTRYYLESLTYHAGLQFGTGGVYFLTSIFSDLLGMSYGGTFLVFNIFGAIGLLALAGALFDILPERQHPARGLVLIFLFLPGVSFWSSAIGKDSLALMATGLACWASLRLDKRFIAMLIALGIFFLVRPHIGGMAVVALALALTFTLRSRIAAKAVLLAVTVPAAAGGLMLGLRYAGLSDPSGVSDITDYIEERQGYNLSGGSSIDISSMSVPARIFSYLFRPLPLESPGLLGMVVGLENIILMAIFAIFLLQAIRGKSRLEMFPLAFMLLFAVATLFILANTTANLGISIRQKWMFVPMLACVAFSYAKMRRPVLRLSWVARS